MLKSLYITHQQQIAIKKLLSVANNSNSVTELEIIISKYDRVAFDEKTISEFKLYCQNIAITTLKEESIVKIYNDANNNTSYREIIKNGSLSSFQEKKSLCNNIDMIMLSNFKNDKINLSYCKKY